MVLYCHHLQWWCLKLQNHLTFIYTYFKILCMLFTSPKKLVKVKSCRQSLHQPSLSGLIEL